MSSSKKHTTKTGYKNKSKSRSSVKSKSKPLFHIEPGLLDKYSYYNVKSKSKISRHRSLNLALKDIPKLSLGRRLNALYVLNKNTNPSVGKIFKQDSIWVFNK